MYHTLERMHVRQALRLGSAMGNNGGLVIHGDTMCVQQHTCWQCLHVCTICMDGVGSMLPLKATAVMLRP